MRGRKYTMAEYQSCEAGVTPAMRGRKYIQYSSPKGYYGVTPAMQGRKPTNSALSSLFPELPPLCGEESSASLS